MAERTAGTRVVLIRHGESNVTVEQRVSSAATCTGLSDLGRAQAERLRDRLAETGEIAPGPDVFLYASGYRRALETAEIIAPALDIDKVAVDEGFGEQDPGRTCDGILFKEFVERYGRPAWDGNPYAMIFPDGETVAAFDLRVGNALAGVLDRHAGGTVVIVCHGGVIDRVLRQMLRGPMSGVFELFTRNTSLTEFVEPVLHKWRMVRYNDAAHLAGLPVSTLAMRAAEG